MQHASRYRCLVNLVTLGQKRNIALSLVQNDSCGMSNVQLDGTLRMAQLAAEQHMEAVEALTEQSRKTDKYAITIYAITI